MPVVLLTKLAISMILMGRLGAAEHTMGTFWELYSIAAPAINGASLMGCIILGTLRIGLMLLNLQAFYLLRATGIVINIAMRTDMFASSAGGEEQGQLWVTQGPWVCKAG